MIPRILTSPAAAIVELFAIASALLAPTRLAGQARPVATPLPQWELRADWIEAQRAAHVHLKRRIICALL